MRNYEQIKVDLLAVLEAIGDSRFSDYGFGRPKGKPVYSRNFGDSRQTITLDGDFLPKYQMDAELHLLPRMHIGMESVSKATLKLVGGNKALLANAPKIIINQPIEFVAPEAEHVRWFASGLDQISDRVKEIVIFVEKRVLPVLNSIKKPEDLISIYENRDSRILRQNRWYLYIAGAKLLMGEKDDAKAVLEKNLGSPGLRRYYASAFKYFE